MSEKHYRATFTRKFIENITKVRNPDELISSAKGAGLQKTLGVKELIIL